LKSALLGKGGYGCVGPSEGPWERKVCPEVREAIGRKPRLLYKPGPLAKEALPTNVRETGHPLQPKKVVSSRSEGGKR